QTRNAGFGSASEGVIAGITCPPSLVLCQQRVDLLQFCHDVDVNRAAGQAVAAGNAGSAVLRQSLVFRAGASEIMVVSGVAFVAQNVGDGNVLRTMRDT